MSCLYFFPAFFSVVLCKSHSCILSSASPSCHIIWKSLPTTHESSAASLGLLLSLTGLQLTAMPLVRKYNIQAKESWIQAHRDDFRKTKAHLEVTLTRDIKGKKRSFVSTSVVKGWTRKMWVLCWIGRGTLWQQIQIGLRYTLHCLPQSSSTMSPRPLSLEKGLKEDKNY